VIGLDTHALLRLLTDDDAAQAELVRNRLAALDATPESVLLNNVVLVETLWTLRRLYDFERSELQDLMSNCCQPAPFALKTAKSLPRPPSFFSQARLISLSA